MKDVFVSLLMNVYSSD